MRGLGLGGVRVGGLGSGGWGRGGWGRVRGVGDASEGLG